MTQPLGCSPHVSRHGRAEVRLLLVERPHQVVTRRERIDVFRSGAALLTFAFLLGARL
ncbi:hypothetical protein KOI35_15585 [Actinoplanes bogorensis]|uniref:Uncharacterized protein n=1 Tax=Paractinoplanes bogorensis TaxID=1610840 RepID=A0ABS5YQC2_9ACTN|nr:hypothetical protein [Actinoplanes bogorensis]MBU2664924.1 hypothetical protein [Actinoplanes bogorensis]